MAKYNRKFYDYVNSGSIRSAERMLPYLTERMNIHSVLDVGCGQGAWLSVWRNLGVTEIHGIDGDYVERSRLLIDEDAFTASDLEQPFDLGRQFDVVQSLEVAEHLSESSASGFVGSLVRHGDIVLFSAAAKGDGGEHHINEQDYDYWRNHFSQHGYVALDYLRPLIIKDRDIEPWYRYNTFLYVKAETVNELPENIRSQQVDDGEPLHDVSPAIWKLRKRVVRLIPVALGTKLAKVKERWMVLVRGATSAR